MACPFFVPTERFDGGGWFHPARLPLGGGWKGQCSACTSAENTPSDDELREFCNLGYAANCNRLPAERTCDAVRFSIAKERASEIVIWFVCERNHRPVSVGTVCYDRAANRWISTHSESNIQRQAECYLQSYLARQSRNHFAVAEMPASVSASHD